MLQRAHYSYAAGDPAPGPGTDSFLPDWLTSYDWSSIQLSDWRLLVPVAIAGLIVWALWLYRVVLSRMASPVENGFTTTTSVVVPSFHEDPNILMACLATWRAQKPTEIIVVLDVADTECFERITELGDPTVRPLLFEHAGKRSAIGVGVREATSEILVLTDSDTQWEPGLLEAVQAPFADPEVGGVGTHQNVFERRTSVWRRVADWLVNLRYYDYVPAMGRAGAVACLSGRTAAYRLSVVLPVLTNLEDEYFLGRRCISGDDGRLTWLVLASGFKTVHQSSARALSMFPDTFRAFVKQRVRWSRNSYRCYLTALSQGWLWRRPFITQVTVLQVLLTPVSMGAAIYYGARWIAESGGAAAGIVLAWAVAGRAIRATSHLRENPRELVLAPVMTLIVAFIALPLKLWAALTMNSQGWLTRYEGARVQGQAEIGVVQHVGQV
jgi:N-acetylglucosaminyltransferase